MNSTPADRYAQIIDAAIKLFRKKNYHGTSMQDIADELGIHRGSLYHYIKSKEEVLFHIIEKPISILYEKLLEIQAEDLPATQKLHKAIWHHVHRLAKHQPEHAIAIEDSKQLSEEHLEKVLKLKKQYEILFQTIIKEGIQQSEFKQMHPKVTFAMLGMMNWIYRWYSPNGELSPDEIAVLFEELIINGLSKTS